MFNTANKYLINTGFALAFLVASYPVVSWAAGNVLWNTEVTTTQVNSANYNLPPTDTFTQDGVDFTLDYLFPDFPNPGQYGGSSIPSPTYFVTTGNTVGNEAGVLGLGMDTVDGADEGNTECIRARFTFNPAIGGLRFPLLDIDLGSWRDMILVRATYRGNQVSGTGTIVDPSPTVQAGTPAGVNGYTCADIQSEFGNGLCFTGITANAANTQTRGNVNFSFPGLVDRLEVSYCESDNGANNSQIAAFGDIAWDVEAGDFGDVPVSYGDARHRSSDLLLQTKHVPAVGAAWQTVNLDPTYTFLSPVVVCTYNLPSATDNEAAVRVRNVSAAGFDVRIQRPLNSPAVTASDVSCLVAEEGLHTLPDGRSFEAHHVLSTDTSGNAADGWNGTGEEVTANILGSYTSPVVLGQVMSFNDADFSAFWSYNCTDREIPPFQGSGNICVGKNIGQTAGPRANETLGYIVVEAGSGSVDGIAYETALGNDSVRGVGDSPPYSYPLGQSFNFAVATQEAMDGDQGGWAVMYGTSPLAGSQIDLAVDEETVAGDTTRRHTTEQVAYWAFSSNSALIFSNEPFIGTIRGDNEAGSQSTVAASGDDTDGNDDESGVTFRSPAVSGKSIFADVVVNNPTGAAVTVCGWLDVPAGASVDGVFNPADGRCQTAAAGVTTQIFQWSALPTDQSYTTYARFRVSSLALTTSDATGSFSDGEVEDYRVVFDFRPTAVTIGQVNLEATPVADFLAGLNIDQMGTASMLAILKAWNPEQAASLANTDRQTILLALRNYLDPNEDGQVAVLRWDTLEERGTIGFYVERREGNIAWQRVNKDMLPGLITAPMGGEYQLADPAASSGRSYEYRLIEQEAKGTTRTYGPYKLEMQ